MLLICIISRKLKKIINTIDYLDTSGSHRRINKYILIFRRLICIFSEYVFLLFWYRVLDHVPCHVLHGFVTVPISYGPILHIPLHRFNSSLFLKKTSGEKNSGWLKVKITWSWECVDVHVVRLKVAMRLIKVKY